MDTNPNDLQTIEFDPKLLGNLIAELNIARRNFRSYPKGHPLIDAALNRVIQSYNTLLNNRGSITLGIARDALMIGEKSLESRNIAFQDFAKTLYERGIAALTFLPGLKADELRNFNIILSLKREEILQHGGITNLWEKARISSMEIIPIQYDMLNTREVDSISGQSGQIPSQTLWQLFTRQLITGTGSSAMSDNDDDIDPEKLAELLNSQMKAAHSEEIHFEKALKGINAETCQNRHDQKPGRSGSYDKLGIFINKLHPELRRKLLSTSVDVPEIAVTPFAEELVSRLTDDAVLDTVADVQQNRVHLPAAILKLL